MLHAEIVQYTSLRIRRRHYETGEFELHIHPREVGAGALLKNRIIAPVGSSEKAMLIKKVVESEGADDLVVTGRTLDGLTKQRIAIPPASSDGTFGWDRITSDAESVLKHYAEVNMTAPSEAARHFDFMTLETNQHRGMPNLPWQARFDKLDELLGKIAKYADLGWDIVPDSTLKQFVFRVVPGRDLTKNNTAGKRVVFSADLGNVSGSTYTDDLSGMCNVAYVGGAGEDEQRLILSVGEGAQGLDRAEMWVDAGSIDNAPDLIAEGHHKLKDHQPVQTLDGTVEPFGAMQYRRDWDLGDLVTVAARRRTMDVRITEIQEVYEPTKPLSLDVTFGDPQRGIVDVIKEIQQQSVR